MNLNKIEEFMPMRKRKRRGFDLVRKDISSNVTSSHPRNGEERKQELARINTRKMMYTSGGQMISLVPQKTKIWLAQMDPFNQIVLEGRLDEEGYAVQSFTHLIDLPKTLKESKDPPQLLMIDALAVAQQVPFFRKMLMPLLAERQVRCLISGLTPIQEKMYRQWYDGETAPSGNLEEIVRHIRRIVGPGLK